MERASGGTWDPITRAYQNEDAIYAEAVADNMVADVPGYAPLPSPPTAVENATEQILSPQHQKEFDRCINDGNERVTVAPKTPIPIRRLSPGDTLNTVTPAKAPPTEIQRDDNSITSGLTETTFGRQAADYESLSTLGSVNTTKTIHSGQGSTPSK